MIYNSFRFARDAEMHHGRVVAGPSMKNEKQVLYHPFVKMI